MLATGPQLNWSVSEVSIQVLYSGLIVYHITQSKGWVTLKIMLSYEKAEVLLRKSNVLKPSYLCNLLSALWNVIMYSICHSARQAWLDFNILLVKNDDEVDASCPTNCVVFCETQNSSRCWRPIMFMFRGQIATSDAPCKTVLNGISFSGKPL